MFKNVASQKITFLVIDTATNVPKTGDSANLTAYVSKDDGAVTVLGDASATELDATNAPGLYSFDLTQAETNADKLLFSGKSSTSGIRVVPVLLYTDPSGFGDLTIANNATAANITRISGSAVSTSTAQLGVNVVQAAGTAWGSGAITAASIASDAITDAKVASDVTIASVTGAVGSVTGAVGSVTGNVGGNVTGSVGSVATGGITAASIATNAIDADALAADAIAEINATVDTALADILLDKLLAGAYTTGVVNNSLWAKLHATGVTADYSDYDNADRSLMALGTYVQSLDEVDLPNVLSRLPAALVSGRIDASVGAMAANTLTASALATDAVTEIQNGLSTVTTAQVNAEVDTALADIHLDHLIASADPTGVVANNSLWAKLHANGVTADYTDYDNADRSLMALGTYAQSLDEVDLPNVLTQIAALAASIASLPDAAAINAQVLDVLTVDTFAEPSSVPAATATIAGKIGWLAALARNKVTQTSTTQTLRNDADDANIATAAHADDGTTHTRSEWT